MKTKKLGNSDLAITPVGFGAWAVGGSWKFGWGKQDDDDSVAAIHRALELGVNWIDTAAAYGLGHSEEVVARALAEYRGERPYVFTKCGIVDKGNGDVDFTVKRDSIRREIEASLKRLRVDVIDLYQMHWPADDAAETQEGWETLAALKKEGKVRWIGVSNFSVEELEAAAKIAPVTSLQPPYSLIKRDAETDLLPYCGKKNIGVIVYSPMGSGMLTGSMTRERVDKLPADDWRRKSGDFQEPKLTANLALAERLQQVGKRHGKSAGEVAIAWTLRQPAVTGAIVGARNAKQVDGVVGGAELKLSDAEIAEIEG